MWWDREKEKQCRQYASQVKKKKGDKNDGKNVFYFSWLAFLSEKLNNHVKRHEIKNRSILKTVNMRLIKYKSYSDLWTMLKNSLFSVKQIKIVM